MKIFCVARNKRDIKYYREIAESGSDCIFPIYYFVAFKVGLFSVSDICSGYGLNFSASHIAGKRFKISWLRMRLVRLSSAVLYACCLRFLKRQKVEGIVIWNNIHWTLAAYKAAAERLGITVVHLELGAMPNTTACDSSGVNFLNSVSRDPDFYRKIHPSFNYSEVKLVPRVSKSSYEYMNLPDEYVFVPFQVDHDSQIKLFSPWITSMRELYRAISDIADSNPGINFVFKQHPSSSVDYSDVVDDARTRSNIYFADGNSTQELIKKASAVITINSSIGLESLMLETPVIVIGQAFYSIDGISVTASSSSELMDVLDNKEYLNADKELISSFITYLRKEYYVDGNRMRPTKDHYQQMNKKIVSVVAGVMNQNC